MRRLSDRKSAGAVLLARIPSIFAAARKTWVGRAASEGVDRVAVAQVELLGGPAERLVAAGLQRG